MTRKDTSPQQVSDAKFQFFLFFLCGSSSSFLSFYFNFEKKRKMDVSFLTFYLVVFVVSLWLAVWLVVIWALVDKLSEFLLIFSLVVSCRLMVVGRRWLLLTTSFSSR